MNLVLSGPMDATLLGLVEALSRPSRMKPLNEHAWRLEDVDDSKSIRQKVAECCASATVDHAYIEADVRFSQMKLLVLDMDSTLITIECIDELADYAGKKAEVAAITEATMRGEIKDFAESLRRRVSLLRGLDAGTLRRVYDERLRLSPGAQTLIDAARANGIYLLLISGGFTYFAERLKDELRFDAAFANRLEVRNQKLTGHVEGNVIDGFAKAAIVRQAMLLTRSQTTDLIVVGDGANDIPMMMCTSHSIAYHAKPDVNKAAKLSVRYQSLQTIIHYFE